MDIKPLLYENTLKTAKNVKKPQKRAKNRGVFL